MAHRRWWSRELRCCGRLSIGQSRVFWPRMSSQGVGPMCVAVTGGRMCISGVCVFVCFFYFSSMALALEDVLWGHSPVRQGQWGTVEEGSEREWIYNDFSFFALGESAPWEFTPLTPLAKKRGGHIQISVSLSSLRRALSCSRQHRHSGRRSTMFESRWLLTFVFL